MANIQQVWESHDGWKALGLRYFVHQDFDMQPDLKNAFDFIVSARIPGAQIGSARVNPLKNQPVDLNVTVGSIKGEINDWQGYDAAGAKKAWSAGGLATARFLLVLDIAITVPIVGKINVKGFHKPCTVLLHWDAKTKKYIYHPNPVQP